MDTSTTYLGLRLAHPYMVGASPLSARPDCAKRLKDLGCAAIVLHSLFEEQVTQSASGRIRHMDPLDPQFADRLSHFPASGDYPYAPDEYLEHVRRLKQALRIPVIASLNGTTAESWLKFGRLIEEAGADGLEINLYEVVTDLDVQGSVIEHRLRDVVAELKRTIHIPVAVKLSPFLSAIGNVARQLDRSGADGLVMFNRFYQPDIDIRSVAVTTNLELSQSSELPLRLRWLAILHGRVRASLAVTGGVQTPRDGIKALLAGAHAVQMVSAILRHGPAYFKTMRETLIQWMEWQKIESVGAMRGRVSLETVGDPSAFERANYIHTLQSWGR